MRVNKLLPVLLLCMLLHACLEPTQVEEAAIINTRGLDIIEEDGKRIVENTIVPYMFDPHAPDSTSILIGRGKTVKEARDHAAKQSSFHLGPGKISIDFYGKEAAASGILPLLNTLVRDARVPDRMQMAVTNQTAREILEAEHEHITVNSTEHLQDLISKEVNLDVLPRNTLEYFTRLTVQTGIDPLLPIIDVIDDKPTLVGAATFQKDRYVGQLSLEEAFYINSTRKNVSETPIQAVIPLDPYQDQISYDGDIIEEEFIHLSLKLNRGRGRISVEDLDNLSFKGEVWMRVALAETSIPMDMEPHTEEIEKDLEDFFQEEYENLFEKLQEMGSDPFGLGRIFTATRHGSQTSEEEWMELYQEAEIEFNIDIDIMHFGTID